MSSIEPFDERLKDSGERREFSSGAVRDRGDLKPRPDLISPHAQMREGMIHTKGSAKYSVRNWEKGMPLSVCLASAQRHIEQYKLGLTDEDHLAQARWNLGAMIHFEEEIRAGRMDSAFADMPHYEKPKPGDRRINPETEQEEVSYVVGVDPESPEGDEPIPPFAGTVHGLQEGMTHVVEPPTFYVCGPMTGMPDFNFPLFDQVTALARSQGLSVISPAELDREHGIDPSVDPNSVERARRADPNLIQTIVQRDTQVIVGLERDKGDGLILLPGWEKSTGARAEIANAIWMELSFKRVVTTWHGQVLHTPQIEDTDLGWVRLHLFYQTHEGITNG